MIKCRYKTINIIVKYYSYDWSNLLLDNVDFENVNLTKIKLPNDTELFQRIKKRSLSWTQLPKGDYSNHCFDDVDIYNAIFTEDSTFSKDIDVFQKIRNKAIEYTVLPEGDYRNYNFNDVIIRYVKFTKNTLLPEESNFLINLRQSWEGLGRIKWPDNVIKNIHNYNLEGLRLDLSLSEYKDILTNNQLNILKIKYPSAIEEGKIILPKEVYGDNNIKGYDIKKYTI